MAHRSRLRRQVIAALERKCSVCGCTDTNPCILEEDGNLCCSWVAADLCSNPDCVEKVTAQVAGGHKDVYLLG